VPLPRSFRARLTAIALLAFALRAAFSLAVAPDSLNDHGDGRFFHLTANLLADGHGYIQPLPYVLSGTSLPTGEHPPLWSAALAVVSLLGGTGYTAHELAGCAVGAGIVAAAGCIGRRFGGVRAGLIAAALVAVYPVYVAMDGSLMSEPPYALALALTLVLALRAYERPGLGRTAALGAAVGATVLVRGEALALIPLLAVPVGWRSGGWRHALAACLVAVAVFGPWCVRNSIVFHTPVLVSSEDGPVFAGANCARTYSGIEMGFWQYSCLGRGHDRNVAFRARRWRREGLDYATHHVGRLPAVLAVRVLRTWGLWQPRRHVYFAEGRMLPGRSFAVAWYWLMLALALPGVWLARAWRGRLAVLLTPVLLSVATSLVAFGYPRFRYAADVAVLVLAAVALDHAAGRLRRVRR
jgi:4-amino-4-deoxy-L-arabinose transferase-like glycosyltransferase